MPLVLDIETVPLAAAMDAPYPEQDRQPPANYKSEDAIGRWRLSDRAKWEADRAKECSLNPRLGRVLCLGTSHGVIMAPTEADERALLEQFWVYVDEADGQVVTWNGSWDLRFLVLRSLHHGVRPSIFGQTIGAWFRKYATAPHFDCKAVVMQWDVRIAGEGLSQWAAFFGVPGKMDGLSGADVYPLYLGGQLEEIATYCAADVAATQAIYERIVGTFGGIG